MRDCRQIIVATAAILFSSAAANAADMPVKAVVALEKIEYGNLFFGVDWNTHKSLVGYSGIVYAPNGMHQSGWRLSAFGLVGRYEYHGGDNHDLFKGNFVSTDALVGWSHVFSNGAVTLAGGVNYQNHRVRPNDPENPVEGSKLGFKVQADLWINPTERTLVTVLGSYSTAFDTYYAAGRFGYDFTNTALFIGPEVGVLGTTARTRFAWGCTCRDSRSGPARLQSPAAGCANAVKAMVPTLRDRSTSASKADAGHTASRGAALGPP